MWSSIENLKQNLNKIALDVHVHVTDDDDDDDENLHIPTPAPSDRRRFNRFVHSSSVLRSPIPNGVQSPLTPEMEQLKAEIKRLKESEEELKALSHNYAAILKDKEDHISRLSQEYGLLKQNLDTTKEALNAARSEISKSLSNGVVKGTGDQSPYRPTKVSTQGKGHYSGNQLQNGISNGIEHSVPSNGVQNKMDSRNSNSTLREKELADLLEEKSRSLAALQAAHELQTKQLNLQLKEERDKLAYVQHKLEEEHRLNESSQKELKMLRVEKENTFMEFSKINNELNAKILEIKRLQAELSRQGEGDDDTMKDLKRAMAALEKENAYLKMAKNEMEAALESTRKSSPESSAPDLKVNPSENSSRKEELELSLQNLEKDLKEARRERDRALQELKRLKQHLLDKELEESEKMDEDTKIIEELRQNTEYQKAQILHLEKALKQAIASQEEIKLTNNNEIQNYKITIEDLKKKLASCMNTIDSKNEELLNLQTALGQYFAEIEAKENLGRQLALAREEAAKFLELLKDAEQKTEALKQEKDDILANLSHAERMMAEGKNRVNKLEEDNAKLRRALEQSMTRLNRMSMDSDYLVDRRIVIKLLVTYFQRNHSKEVLDLMVRMLGFSTEDKQRIGVAQGGKGVVRGVLGLPGRLVGGILGGSSPNANASAASDNQSFADLWVDFLLKEVEEREKKEAAEDTGKSNADTQSQGSPITAGVSPAVSDYHGNQPNFSRPNYYPVQNYSQIPLQGNLHSYGNHSDSEFSSVPLTSSDSASRISRLLQKH